VIPLHPKIQRALDKTAGLPPMESFSPAEIRATELAAYAAVPRREVAQVEERLIPGPRGELKVRIYRPDAERGHPLLTFFHGSGFVICSLDTHDGLCRQLCISAGAVVVSVDYALAPENKFPAAVDDCLAAVRWTGEHAADFGGDRLRHVLAGDSAGGALAIVTAMRIRDEGGPPIKAQLLMYPVADYPDPEPPSYRERGTGCGLTAAAMRYFWGHYLRNSADGAHPHASPLRATDFTRLPATYVMIAEYDPLRDEGARLVDRLTAAGVDTTCVRYADMNHGFMSWVGIIDRSAEALQAACAWLASRL
jgi:acetyl esterase